MKAVALATRGRLDPSCLGVATHGYILPNRNPVINNTVDPPIISVTTHLAPKVGPGQDRRPRGVTDLWRDYKPVNRG